ncbi:MAG: hydroxyacylglutathione hydrolase [Methanobacterium sp. PtaB.Bin024]|nr:MAG: hydroxyacylglutathione hydrolase [Methanobacterium sp. PtaB.Bin024]
MKITDEVYALEATKNWNYAYLISGEKKMLIDTGRPGQGKGIIKELKSMDINPRDIQHILITHHDVDHVGNLAFLQEETGASVWASREDIPYIYGDKHRPGQKRIISMFMRVKKPGKIMAYEENQKVEGVQVIPTPGHTPGHVCLLYKDILFTGDLVRNSKGSLETMKSSMNWNESILKESIEKTAAYDFKWICTAHGQPLKLDNAPLELAKVVNMIK